MFIMFAPFEPRLESGRQPLAVWRFNKNTHHLLQGMSQHVVPGAICFKAAEDMVVTFWGNDRALNKWYPADPMKREQLEAALKPPPGCISAVQAAKNGPPGRPARSPSGDQMGGAVVAAANRLRAAIAREGGSLKAAMVGDYVSRRVRGGRGSARAGGRGLLEVDEKGRQARESRGTWY